MSEDNLELMKKNKHNLIFTFLLIAFFLIIQGPNLINNFQMQGSTLDKLNAQNIATNEEFLFPPNGNSVVIFWATWCAPCKLEMKRLQSSIEAKEIKPKQVFAYNPFEETPVIKKFISEHKYDFQFFSSQPALEKVVKVKATPTYLWLEKNKIYRMTTGISLINLWWLNSFL